MTVESQTQEAVQLLGLDLRVYAVVVALVVPVLLEVWRAIRTWREKQQRSRVAASILRSSVEKRLRWLADFHPSHGDTIHVMLNTTRGRGPGNIELDETEMRFVPDLNIGVARLYMEFIDLLSEYAQKVELERWGQGVVNDLHARERGGEIGGQAGNAVNAVDLYRDTAKQRGDKLKAELMNAEPRRKGWIAYHWQKMRAKLPGTDPWLHLR